MGDTDINGDESDEMQVMQALSVVLAAPTASSGNAKQDAIQHAVEIYQTWKAGEEIEERKPLKLHFTDEWLRRKIASDPDDAEYEAGASHPEAPQPRFFIDHGMIHDRATGCHVTTAPDDETWNGGTITSTCALLNELAAALLASARRWEEMEEALRGLEAVKEQYGRSEAVAVLPLVKELHRRRLADPEGYARACARVVERRLCLYGYIYPDRRRGRDPRDD